MVVPALRPLAPYMAKVTSREKFLDLLRRSHLVAEDRLAEILKKIQQSDQRPRDANELANRFIEAKLLNQWQVDNLLKGKYKGFTLGKYKLLGHLGTGGMSSVYLAEHPVMERLVAVKVLPKRFVEDPNYLDRFKREARAVAALDHPNIVRAFDIDQDGNTHYIVMEYVQGRDLQKIVKQDGPLDPCDAMDYIAQAALGLQHAHHAGLVHRDIKPANCLVDKSRCVKLLDLGLAMFSEDDRPSLSAKYDDSVVGTADYLAPEQARNSQNVDSRADIYSLGCTLYFLLTGQPPFPDGSIAERLLKHQTEQPPSLYDLRSDAPPAVVELCRRMMIKDPAQRIQQASQVADEIRSWLTTRGRSITFDHQLASTPVTLPVPVPVESGSGWSRSGGSGRLGKSPTPPPMPRRPTTDDTRPSAKDDTARIGMGSSVNDDLELAPLEEEKRDSSGSGLHDDDTSDPSKADAATGSASSIDEMQLERYGSGPLDALLEDPQFSSNIQMRTQPLTKKLEPPWYQSSWLIVAVLAILGVLAAVLVLSLLV